VELRYEGHYQISTRTGLIEDSTGMLRGHLPVALIASKYFLTEALEQYLRNAEWFCDGYIYDQNLSAYQSSIQRLAQLGIMYKMPQNLSAYAGNLSYHKEPPWHQGSWHKGSFERTAEASPGISTSPFRWN
jgi:hypothetical protein